MAIGESKLTRIEKYMAAIEQRKPWEILLRAKYHVRHDKRACALLDRLFDRSLRARELEKCA